MAHLFNRTEYYDYRSRVYANIKKTLENKIESLADALPHAHTHPIEHHDEHVLDSATLTLTYEQQHIQVPSRILEVDLTQILTPEVIRNELTS